VAARVRAQVRSLGSVVEKVTLGQVFSNYFGPPANSHSINCSIFIITTTIIIIIIIIIIRN
jgi:hypothetical protein